MPHLKLTDEVAAEIKARVKGLDFGTIEKLKKAKNENGSFDVIVSTEVKDRAGEIVRQNGWDLANYKNNPIVLWGHDYYGLPIGICTETYNTTYRGVPALGARGVFYPAEVNPLAQQVRRMYEYGVKSGYNVGCTTSVGFIPKEFDPEDSSIITRAELLEFSFVPIPANQGVGPASGRSLSFAEARQLGIDIAGMRLKGVSFAETVGFIPKDTSDKLAPAKTGWTVPSLKDFTDKSWDELSQNEKQSIAKHFAYSQDPELKAFEDLKLPYRRPSDGAVVLSGLRSTLRSLTRDVTEEGDIQPVYDHLASYFKLFGKEAPELASLKEAKPGDHCTMDDGTPGVLTTDPKDPDGALVCLPEEQDKSDKAHASQKELVKALGDEHERHSGEIDKALDDFREKSAEAVPEDQGDPVDANEGKKGKAKPNPMREALKDLRSALSDEHTMHRAKTIACFRAFDPAENKAFDRKPHLKALREEHGAYEQKCTKAVDDLEERCMKSVQGTPGSADEHTDWITGLLETHGRAHKKAVVKIAKAMCKEAFGEEDQADEKVLEILSEHLAAYVPEPLQRAVFQKVGARISTAKKEKLAEAHQHMKAASAVVEALHGGLGNDDGEESRSEGDEKSTPTPAPRTQRSRPTEDVRDRELDAHLLAKDILRGITTVAQRGLENLNKQARK